MSRFNDSSLEQLRSAMQAVRAGAHVPMDIVDVVDALREEVERLRAQNAAWREIAQAVASHDLTFATRPAFDTEWRQCPFCAAIERIEDDFQHDADCPITKARALLASEETR